MVAQVAPDATRPCYLHSNHGGEHLFLLRGVIVNAEGKPLVKAFTESPVSSTKASG